MARPNELCRIEALGNERPREMVIAHCVGTESGLQAYSALGPQFETDGVSRPL